MRPKERRATWRRTASLHTLAAAAASLGLLGCRDIPFSPPSTRSFLSLTLIAGRPTHLAFIADGVPPESLRTNDAQGLTAERVDLWVVDPDGGEHPLAEGEGPGVFVVTMDVSPGRRYELRGTIDDRPVTAHTVVPAAFTIRTPAGDTITTADATDKVVGFFSVPYVFEHEGASAFEVRILVTDGTLRYVRGVLDRPAGTLSFVPDSMVRELAFLAYNADAAEWLLRRTPRSNLTGAFGGFGAALLRRRWVWLP
jgi:hypothetical protein